MDLALNIGFKAWRTLPYPATSPVNMVCSKGTTSTRICHLLPKLCQYMDCVTDFRVFKLFSLLCQSLYIRLYRHIHSVMHTYIYIYTYIYIWVLIQIKVPGEVTIADQPQTNRGPKGDNRGRVLFYPVPFCTEKSCTVHHSSIYTNNY